MDFRDEWLQNCGEGNPKYPHGFTLISSIYILIYLSTWIITKIMDPSQSIQASAGWNLRDPSVFFGQSFGHFILKWDAKPDQPTMNLGVMNHFKRYNMMIPKRQPSPLFQPFPSIFFPRQLGRDVLPHLQPPSHRDHSSEWPSLTTKALSFPRLAWVSAHPSLQYLSSWPSGTPSEGGPKVTPRWPGLRLGHGVTFGHIFFGSEIIVYVDEGVVFSDESGWDC